MDLSLPYTAVAVQPPSLDVEKIRKDFPALAQQVHGQPLVYVDNAATTQKPEAVIEAIAHHYHFDNANIHRGVHALSERATLAYENARQKAARRINAADPREIIFLRGVTEAINLIAQTYGREHIGTGDEILLTEMEHHANIVPWQLLCEQTGAVIKVIPFNEAGELITEEFERLLNAKTRLVGVVAVSNSLGTINPIAKIIEYAHAQGVPVLVDGAQTLPHQRVDVQALDSDFFVFSGHKLYGPSGIGVLHAKAKLLENMPPYQGGGDMIRRVSFTHTEYNDIPYKFEAGTPNIEGAIGLGAAIDYLDAIGIEAIAHHEAKLLAHANQLAAEIPAMRLIGTAKNKASILSFTLEGVHPHDIGTIMDHQGVAIRAGHHCTMPVMQHFGIPATARASFAFYNTHAEVETLFKAIRKVLEVMLR